MQNDVNSKGYTQWFYFRIANTTAGNTVKFTVMNFTKSDSMFNYGLKIAVYSEKRAQQEEIAWTRECDNILYYPNGIKKVQDLSKQYYSLTFSHTFMYDQDFVYFAYSVPYSYSDLRRDINEIENDEQRSFFMQRKTFCKDLSGEDCEILTISSRDKLDNYYQRKGIVLTARVHPGETVGSWMMRGALFFLTDPHNEEARLLRENFVFKVIPMLNPDGVISGNYRCGLAGCDLNRRYKNPSKILHPIIYQLKKLVKSVHQERELTMFLDMHGHSRKSNVFMYGCDRRDNPKVCRLFPYILSKLSPYFSFENSRFWIQEFISRQ